MLFQTIVPSVAVLGQCKTQVCRKSPGLKRFLPLLPSASALIALDLLVWIATVFEKRKQKYDNV
jgi:hypothetical protein